MQITIQRMTIRQFKGVKNLTLDLDGQSANIRGRNGTGKTSVFDAFTWLLFGKDSQNNTVFDYKPLDENGRPRTGADTEVEAVLRADGKTITLKRVRHEKWQQKPGSPAPIYQGDETLCWIDDVPVKLEKDYQPYIASLIGDEERFKVLSIHGYFMAKPWKERRRMLVDAAGGDAEEEIMRQPQFAQLPDILQGHTPDEARKRLTEQKKRVDAELKIIPARLDEIQRGLTPVTDQELEAARDEIARKNAQIDLINSRLAGTEEAFTHARALIAKEREITVRLEARKKALDAPNATAWNELQQNIAGAKRKKDGLAREIQALSDDLFELDGNISALQTKRESLLAEWNARESETFAPGPVASVCRLCGQPLPSDQIREAKMREYAVWADAKNKDLDEIEQRGKTTAERIARLQSERGNVAESLERKRAALADAEGELQRLTDAADQPMEAPDYESDPEYAVLLADLAEIRDEIARPDNSAAMREELTRQRNELAGSVRNLSTVQYARDTYERGLARIKELEDQREKLGQDAVRIDGELMLLGEFVHACCDAMEERINAMFHSIRWHLTDYTKDGTPVDCCIPYVGGVSYDSTLNAGARINAGIEAIRVLSGVNHTTVPCFVDNSERVNDLAYTGGQMIRLTVSNDPELTMILEG